MFVRLLSFRHDPPQFSGHCCGNVITSVLASISISKEMKLVSTGVTVNQQLDQVGGTAI